MRDSTMPRSRLRIRHGSPRFWTKRSAHSRSPTGTKSSNTPESRSAAYRHLPMSSQIRSCRRTTSAFHWRAPAAGRPRVLDEHGCAQPRGWLDRARRPRREEPYDHRSGRQHVHAEAVPSRQGQQQTLLARSRGHARDASESRRLERRDPRGHEPGRSSTGAGCDEMVRRDHARSGARPHVLDAERSGQRRAGSYLPGGYRRPERREARPPQRHRGAVRAFAGADRPRARPRASRPLLDRSRRPASRQHRESRTHRRGQSRRAGDRDDAFDGGHRPRAGRSARPDVRDRLRRLRLLRQARWLRQADVPLRKGQPHRRHLRRNRRKGEVIMAYDKPIHTIAIVGTGVIGASWAALYLAHGFNVVATDPAPNAEAHLRKYVDEAWKVLTSIGLSAGASRNPPAFP